MHDLAKYLTSPLMKGESFQADSWDVRKKELYENKIIVTIKDGLPSSMQYELEDNQEEYSFLAHEYWFDLLSTIGFKYNIKRDVT